MSASRNAHLLMRSPPHERFAYVALPARFALTGRGLRAQHHISGKTTFWIRLSSWWLPFEKISRCNLLNFQVRSVVVSRYRGGQ